MNRIHPEIAANLLTKYVGARRNEGQGWALIGRHVPFALFSSFVEVDEKSRIAARLFAVRDSTEPPPPVPLGRPPFPEIVPGATLAQYITEESWLLFDLLDADTSWLRETPPWDGHPGHDEVRDVLRSFCGVNDPAERLCGIAKQYAVSIIF